MIGVEPIVSAQTQVSPEFWLNAANRAIRAECGWHVAPIITETLTLDGSGTHLLPLPSKRVVSVLTVLNDGVDVTNHVDTSRAGLLELQHGCWTRRLGKVSVTLLHGYDVTEVPDVAALIVTLTKRASAGGGAVVQQAVGGASVRFATSSDGAALGVPLLQLEKDLLAAYRLEGTP